MGKVGRGTSVNWPVGGSGGKGNEGVSGQVQQTPNSIGYVELIFAVQNKMKTSGKVKNLAGNYVVRRASSRRASLRLPRVRKRCPRISGFPSPTLRAKTPLPNLQLHLAADSRENCRSRQEKGHQGFLDVDAGRQGQNMTEALAYARLPQRWVVAKSENESDSKGSIATFLHGRHVHRQSFERRPRAAGADIFAAPSAGGDEAAYVPLLSSPLPAFF